MKTVDTAIMATVLFWVTLFSSAGLAVVTTATTADCEKVLTFFDEPFDKGLRPDADINAKIETLNEAVDEPLAAIPDDMKAAIKSFNAYDWTLRKAIIEGGYLIDPGLLSLIGEGHFFLTGDGGTGKSMVAQKMLENIVFAPGFKGKEGFNTVAMQTRQRRDGQLTSYLKKQMTSSTTFSDVFGPTNSTREFQQDGRRERHLDQGVTGFAFTFFDELPDADARLLRALLNLANERELSEYGTTHYGQTRTIFGTSNYYLPEILLLAKRKGIKLEMLFDRFRYIAMVPRAFAHEGALLPGTAQVDSNSYEKLFGVVLDGDGDEISPLPFEHLLKISELAKTVKVPDVVREFWQRVSKRVDHQLKLKEQAAAEEYQRLVRDGEDPPPPYRMTKPMTKRTIGAGARELRNIVALDYVRRGGQRALVANFTDVYRLQYFSGLVGPNANDLSLLIASSGHAKDELATLNTVETERSTYISVYEEIIDEILTEISRNSN